MTAGPPRNIPRLYFLRGLCAGIVVAYHFGWEGIAPGGLGLLIFFVISGFLITHMLLLEDSRFGTISLRNFYIRRSLRIFPAFYVYCAIAVSTLLLHHSRVIWPQFFCALLYVSNYYQGLHGYPSTLFSNSWSLSVEEQFYLLWPLAVLCFRHSLPRLTSILMWLIPGLWLYRALLHFGGVNEAYIYTAFETRIDGILVGCLMAIVLYNRPRSVWLAEVRRARYLPVCLALLLASFALGSRFGIAYRNVIGFAIDPVLIALSMLQFITWDGAPWTEWKLPVYLGRIAYSTYLYQQLILPILRPWKEHGASLPVCLVCIWLVSAASYEFVEKPFIGLERRFRRSASRQTV